MYRQYQTNSQAWDEVMSNIEESERRTEICKEMFGQENLRGLTNEQKARLDEIKKTKQEKPTLHSIEDILKVFDEEDE